MSPINKYEAFGIFASVAVMAVALVVIRFNSDTFATVGDAKVNNVATVVATADADSVKDALIDSVALNGELKKLVIDDVKIGKGTAIEEGSTVTVHYIGTLKDGTQFDNSYVRGEPFTFTLGEGKVIRGWEDGLIGMKVGGERILVIPPDLAYGDRQVGPIPANSPLIFKVELVSVK